MENKKPLLSICVLTYERANGLRETLQSIVRQFDDPEVCECVEVVISDNASTDNTSDIVKNFQNRFSNIKYYRNDVNIGFDRNVLNVVEKATGSYCWYMADDDMILDGVLEAVLGRLQGGAYDVITVESTPIPRVHDLTKKVEFSPKSFVEVQDGGEFQFRGYCQGGVSVLMFNRDLWLSVVDKDDILEHWLYYETVLRALIASHKKKLYIQQPCVATGQDCRWAKGGNELFTFVNSNVLLQRMIGIGFDRKRVLWELRENSKSILIILLRAKGNGLPCTLANLNYIYNNLRGVSVLRLMLSTAIYFVPNWIVAMIRDARKKVVVLLK